MRCIAPLLLSKRTRRFLLFVVFTYVSIPYPTIRHYDWFSENRLYLELFLTKFYVDIYAKKVMFPNALDRPENPETDLSSVTTLTKYLSLDG